ncbi:hypothetical protein B4U80_11316 [Leptotrombidium deliense]|uniref:Uncharacterized protein n=1 Tax=Leptotrombidium deliense TaxID=299467 RepID=A0A443SVU4_9ACAR|nr:hypothetical protein B4U80_11316 [Leptotrombidium deliense]
MLRYQKCLDGLPKQVFGLFARSAKEIIKDRCDTEEGKKEFLRHAQCIRKPEIYAVNKCVHQSNVFLRFIDRNATSEEVAPALCCSIYVVADCLKQQGDLYCANVSGSDTGKYMADISLRFAQNMIDFGCGQTANVAECEQEEPYWMDAFRTLGTPLDKVTSKKQGTMIRNMMRLSKRFFENDNEEQN